MLALICLAPALAAAHHSGLYDNDRVVTIEGTITRIDWINPHVRLMIEADSEAGSAETWEVEGTSVNALERWGIARDRFSIGDRVTVQGPASRFGRRAMIGATARMPDGRQVVLWPNVAARLGLAETGVTGLFPPPAAAATRQGQGIFRVWTPRGRPRGQALPLTDAAREMVSEYNALEDDPALRCIPPGMPVMLDTPYPIEFVDQGDRILMRFEEWDALRTIHMTPRNGSAAGEPSPKGESFGRWEDATLAIFTTHINYPYFDDLGTPQSTDVTVLERYTLNDAETRLDWEVTVTDPQTFTAPIERRGYLAYEPGEVIKAFNCTLPPG